MSSWTPLSNPNYLSISEKGPRAQRSPVLRRGFGVADHLVPNYNLEFAIADVTLKALHIERKSFDR